MNNKIFLLFACILFAGCTGTCIYTDYQDIRSNEWSVDDTLCFELPRMDCPSVVSPTVMVRINDNYRHNRLNMLVELVAEKVVTQDTLSIELFSKSGKSQGKGLVHPESVVHLPEIPLDTIHYTYRIRSLMTDSVTAGVSSIGIRIDKSVEEIISEEDGSDDAE